MIPNEPAIVGTADQDGQRRGDDAAEHEEQHEATTGSAMTSARRMSCSMPSLGVGDRLQTRQLELRPLQVEAFVDVVEGGAQLLVVLPGSTCRRRPSRRY